MTFGQRLNLFLVIAIILTMLTGCSKAKEEYNVGIYWLEKEKNWQMAVKAFSRSLKYDPNRWDTHVKLLEAMSNGEEAHVYEDQLRQTLVLYPDSARATAIVSPSTLILGEDRYNRLASSFELQHIGDLLAKRGEEVGLLARGIMAGCRSSDTVAVSSYLQRMIKATEGKGLPDSVRQELNFFIGPLRVEWQRYEWMISNEPDNIDHRLAQLETGMLMGDSIAVRNKLHELAAMSPDAVNDPDIAKRFGRLVGFDPFKSRNLMEGWDGFYSPDRKSIVYVKDLGKAGKPDIYMYMASSAGGSGKPILKAAQENLGTVAWPRYSPDGKWIYFFGSGDKEWEPGTTGRFYLYRVKPVYGSRPQKMSDSELIPSIPFFEASGTILVVRKDPASVRASVEIIRINPETRKATFLSRIGEPVSGAVFSTSGDSLIFMTNRGLFRRFVQGGVISVDLDWIGFQYPQLSPDGKYLLLTSNAGQLILLDRTTSRTTYLGLSSGSICDLQSDGSMLVTQTINGRRWVVGFNVNERQGSLEDFVKLIQ